MMKFLGSRISLNGEERMDQNDKTVTRYANQPKKTGLKFPYSKPRLTSFGTVSSVTGSNMVGSFFDTMTSMINNTNMAPM